MKVAAVDKHSQSVTFTDQFREVTILDNRIISQIGSLSPVEHKQVLRQYNAIIK